MPSFSIKNSIVLLIAIASLIPITFNTDQAGLFINYFYVLLLFVPFIKFRYSKTGISLLIIFSFIFLSGIKKLLTNDLYYFVRVLSSYIIFMIPFLLIFIKIEDAYFQKFKQAVIYVSFAYSLMLIYQLMKIGYQGDFYDTKNLMGSNRYGFVIIFAFFVLLYEPDFRLVFKLLFLTTFLIGLTLTFSRSSIVSFSLAAAALTFANLKRLNFRYIIGASVFGIILIIAFRDSIIGQIVNFFSEYILSYDKYNLANAKTSEGYRVYVFNQIISYVRMHPLFGSNYAGLYLLYDEYKTVGASAHNQYTDVLLRTGIVGLFTFFYLLFKTSKYYFYTNSGVFYGLLGILIYGLFHETFKLAHGSFIFAILVSHYLYKKEPSYTLVDRGQSFLKNDS